MSTIKHGCPNCGPGIMERDRSEEDKPIWKCRNCRHEMPRRTWKTKKRKEREERIDKTGESLAQLGWERAMGMRGYAGSPAQREDRMAK